MYEPDYTDSLRADILPSYNDSLMHHGIKGMHWGVRRFQNTDGSLTNAGKQRYGGFSLNPIKRFKEQYERNELERKSQIEFSNINNKAVALNSSNEVSKIQQKYKDHEKQNAMWDAVDDEDLYESNSKMYEKNVFKKANEYTYDYAYKTGKDLVNKYGNDVINRYVDIKYHTGTFNMISSDHKASDKLNFIKNEDAAKRYAKFESEDFNDWLAGYIIDMHI